MCGERISINTRPKVCGLTEILKNNMFAVSLHIFVYIYLRAHKSSPHTSMQESQTIPKVVLKCILFKTRIKQLVPHGKGFIGKYSGICGICQSQLKGTRIVCISSCHKQSQLPEITASILCPSTRQKHTASKQQETQPSDQTHSQGKIYMHAKCFDDREK